MPPVLFIRQPPLPFPLTQTSQDSAMPSPACMRASRYVFFILFICPLLFFCTTLHQYHLPVTQEVV